MAISNPRGLLPVKYRDGSPWTGQASMYFVPASDATPLFIGDPVKGVTNSADAFGNPVVTRAAAGDTLIGVVIGVTSFKNVTRLQSDPSYRQASTAAYVLVADDPDLLFEVEETGAMVIGAGGRNANLSVIAGSTVTGYSGSKLDSATLATTNTLQLRIHRLVDREDNLFGTGALKWLASINLHAFQTTTGV
jgi:hypothetical protein